MYVSLIIIVILITVFTANYFFNKIPSLRDKKNYLSHKSFTDIKSKPPFSGGIILLISLLILLPNENYILKIFCCMIFLVGFLSDVELFKSPNIRFFVQLILILSFVILTETFITSTKIDFIDSILENLIFKAFFVTLCILILINGSNFIDGVNTLAIGYFLLILFFLKGVYIDLDDQLIPSDILNYLIASLVGILILNFFNLLYLGDNGAYLISFIIGIFLIDLAENYSFPDEKHISPYYIINLLWYPAFENLFSIIRKFKKKKLNFTTR